MKKFTMLLILLLPFVLLTGCETPRTRLQPVSNTVYGTQSLQTVEKAILVGAAKAGWVTEKGKGNVVHAVYRMSSRPWDTFEDNPRNTMPGGTSKTLLQWIFERKNGGSANEFLTDEQIVYVIIGYNAKSYRIDYEYSENMGFDDESDSIFNTYLPVVKELDRSIQGVFVYGN